jgi:TolB protein
MSEDWLLANAGTQMGFDVLLTYDEGEDLGETVTLTHPGGCVDPTATPTNTPTATPTNTPTATPTPTATSVPIEEEKEIPTATAPVIPHSVSPMRFPETCSDWLLYHRVSPDGMALYRLEGVEGQESASLVTLTDAGAEIETSPSRSWDQQWIAYQSNAAGNWDILLMDSFGADHVVLVDDAGDDVNPMFSPDNRTIVFQSNRNGNWDLFTVDRLTGKTRQITDTEGNDINPYFSPNPDWLVYQSDAAGSWDIYVLYLPTGYQFRITDTETAERLPAWSPNGQHLAYLQKSEAGLWQLVISRIDGSQARVISVDQPASLAWSPDGWRLAYQAEVEGNLDIFYYDLNSDQEIRLTEYEGLDMAPSWNCDGSKIAFNSARSGENENIFSIDLGSLTLTQLTNHEEDDQWPLWFMAKEFASQAVLSGHSMHYITGKMAKIKP